MTTPSWLESRKALRDQYDAAISRATQAASVGTDGRSLAYQRIDTLVRLRAELDAEIALAESDRGYPYHHGDYPMKAPGFWTKMVSRFGGKAAGLPDWGGSGREYDPNNPDTGDALFNPAEMQLVASADSAVLGERGIYPLLPTPEADLAWDDYQVDPYGLLCPRDYQAVILTALILHGEAWVRDTGGGFYEVMPAPDQFRHDQRTGLRTRVIWNSGTIPQGLDLPIEQVHQFVIMRLPFQTRGMGMPTDTRTLMKRSGDLALATANAEIMYRAWATYFQGSGAARAGSTPGEEKQIARKIQMSLRAMAPLDLRSRR